MDLYSMIEAGGRIKLEVTGEDLVKFAERLIEMAQEMKARELAQQPTEEVWLTTKEAAEKCHARTTTLQAWAKAGYPVPAKTGGQKLFALSDIQKILNDRGGGGKKQQL